MKKGVISFLAAGILTGLAGGTLLVARVNAQQPPQMVGPRYQYKCLTNLPGPLFKPESMAAVNAEGAQGWRLLEANVKASGFDQYCFVRQY